MATTPNSSDLPSDVLLQACRKVRVDVFITVQGPLPSQLREVPAHPLAAWFEAARQMYMMYETRGWTANEVNRAVGAANYAALRFARAVLSPGSVDLINELNEIGR